MLITIAAQTTDEKNYSEFIIVKTFFKSIKIKVIGLSEGTVKLVGKCKNSVKSSALIEANVHIVKLRPLC